ncbi:hypothetical protein QQF64_020806 [Cirrhinus molitorella]|uniref:Secreted protein n=1 Tax=Cirrhinus molitorella TaxID=172907 RepID=A0ABR3LA73_9TELE
MLIWAILTRALPGSGLSHSAWDAAQAHPFYGLVGQLVCPTSHVTRTVPSSAWTGALSVEARAHSNRWRAISGGAAVHSLSRPERQLQRTLRGSLAPHYKQFVAY